MEENIPKHAKDSVRGTIKISDFRPKNLHPKAKARILMSIAGTLLIIFGCFYMLSMSTFYFETDMTTSMGLSNFFSNMVFFGYIIGSIFVILILWYVMIKDCPISPAAKINYDASHDKSMKGVKIVAAVASAIANKGSGDSIEYVANTVDEYFTTEEQEEQNGESS